MLQDYRESKYQGRTGVLGTSAWLSVRVMMGGAVQGVQVSKIRWRQCTRNRVRYAEVSGELDIPCFQHGSRIT